jgi:twitching motility protein PilT
MGAKLGMQTMEMALAKIFQEGKVSWDAAMSKSSKPEELERLIGPAPKGTAPKAKAH